MRMSPAAFEDRARAVKTLAAPHQIFDDALERFAEFAEAMKPDWSQKPVDADDDRLLSFGSDDTAEDDGEDLDSHQMVLLVIGTSGTGKSTLLSSIASRPEFKSRFGGPHGDIRPFVPVILPDNPTPREVISELFTTLRSPPPTKWTRGYITRRLRTLLKEIGTQFVAFDEGHVWVDGLTAKQVTNNARMIKYLLVKVGIPIIIFGEEPLTDLLSHKAFKRRAWVPIHLDPYVWRYEEDVSEFMALAGRIVHELGFRESPVSTDIHVAKRLYCDTGGVVGFIAKRLTEAARISNRAGDAQIAQHHLAAAWQLWAASGNVTRDVVPKPLEILSRRQNIDQSNPYAATEEKFAALWVEQLCLPRAEESVARGEVGKANPRLASVRGFRK